MDEEGNEIKLDPVCELFRMGDPEYRSISTAARIWVPACSTAIGLTAALFVNVASKRPTFSGIQRFATWGIGGFVVGLGMDRLKHNVLAEKDLQYYHYMTLHPEDFQPPKRVKYRDYLGPYVPIR